MPDPLLTAAIKEAYASAPAGVVILDTLQLDHPVFTEPVRVVLAHDDVVATLEDGITVATFKAFAFAVDFPPMGEKESAPQFSVRLDGVSREIVEHVEAASQDVHPVTMTYRAYLSNDLSGPQNTPMQLDVVFVHADVFSVTVRAALPNLANAQFPKQDYTAVRFPGLVA